ncbi:MAG: (Fe-S)-binding protein [Planctomycetes bacterium]|nr:(Fe-S)-binding protein [Planctomycetota bacterium]
MKVSLMITCLGDVIRPEVGKAAVRLLQRLGHEVDFPVDQTYCGQPMFNSGFAKLAQRQAKHTIKVFEGDDPVVVPSGSCAAMVKVEFPHVLQGDPKWHERALNLAERTYEFTDFLVNRLNVVDVGASYAGRVAYHFACHLRLLGLSDEVPQLMEHVQGATLVPLARQDQGERRAP